MTGGKDIPYAAQKPPAKIRFPSLSFIASLATSAMAATGCFPISFSATADWRRSVAASQPRSLPLYLRIIHLTDHTSIQSVRAINSYIHTSINDPFNDRTRQMFRFLFISSPAVSSWFFYPFSFLSAPIYSFRCTVRAPVIVYH